MLMALFPLTSCDAILKRTVVEDIGWKSAESWMHTILDLETNRPDAQDDQTLEKRLTETGTRGLFAHDHWSELAVISDEYELFGAEHDWDHALGLGGLCALVDEDAAELVFGQTWIAGANTCATNNIGVLKRGLENL